MHFGRLAIVWQFGIGVLRPMNSVRLEIIAPDESTFESIYLVARF